MKSSTLQSIISLNRAAIAEHEALIVYYKNLAKALSLELDRGDCDWVCDAIEKQYFLSNKHRVCRNRLVEHQKELKQALKEAHKYEYGCRMYDKMLAERMARWEGITKNKIGAW